MDSGSVDNLIKEAQEKEEDEESDVKVNDDSTLMFNDSMGSMMMSQKQNQNYQRSASATLSRVDRNSDIVNQPLTTNQSPHV